jgi:hypothetical protein
VTPVVTRADRSRDVLAMVVVLAGAAIYAYAWLGMHNLATKQLVIPTGTPAMFYFDRYWQLFRLARVVLLVGAAIVAWSFWSHFRRKAEPA